MFLDFFKSLSLLLLTGVLLILSGEGLQGREAEVTALRTDFRETPLAIDRLDPMLSWQLKSERRGAAQQEYHIQAATLKTLFDEPDLWDSGWVVGANSTAIPYAGRAFPAKERVYWRVRVRDELGEVLSWSEPTWFEAGLLGESSWQGADWISCSRELTVERPPREVMGPWIGLPDGVQSEDEVTLSYQFSLPDKLVVSAGTWWSQVEGAEIELKFNGHKGLRGTEGPPTIYYNDFGHVVKAEGNELSVTVSQAALGTPISVGMRIVFGDGTEQIVQTSADWQVAIGSRKAKAKEVCRYGAKPLGEAQISPRAPLPAAWYKKDFDVAQPLQSARLYLCGLGYHEPYLNGEKVGDHVLDPAQGDYQAEAFYQVFDVQEHLREGDNSLSVLLGDGWYHNDRWFSHSRHLYGKPGLRALLELRYADGTRAVITSDKSWHWKPSGLMMSSVFMGDHLDYRKWHQEWRTPGTPAGWLPVKKVKALSAKLTAQDFPPIRIVEEIEPVKTWQVADRTWIVDLGKNISGWISLDFNEPAGTTIRIRSSEMLAKDNHLLGNVPESFWTCHAAPQNHSIIADGKPHQWRPYFSYHGFRYAEISGLSKAPQPGQIKGLFVHTDVPITATFQSSDPLLDRIFAMGIRSHHGNMHSILEDCPHREKCMWGGDLHSSWATGFYALDSATFYRQQVRLFYTPPFDPIGIPGRIGVGKRSTNKTLDLTWSVSPLFIAWRNFQMNGDLQTAEAYYEPMRAFLSYFERKSPHLIPHIFRYGDHASPKGIPRTPADPQLIAAFNFFAAAERFGDFAEALGKEDDAKWSRELAERIRQSILKRYYDAQKKTFGNGTHDSLALEFGLVDPADRVALASSLAKIYQENGMKFDGGFMSYNIYPQLAEYGYVDLALAMLCNPDYPGLAQSIRDYDATTIFEKFLGNDRATQQRTSLNHHAMNHPTAWLLNSLAGIRQDPAEAGFRRILLAPQVPRDLQSVEASVQTAYGLVKSAWQQDHGRVSWAFTIPANCVATMRWPTEAESLQLDGESVPATTHERELAAGTYLLTWTRR